jgi:hypothetical protein
MMRHADPQETQHPTSQPTHNHQVMLSANHLFCNPTAKATVLRPLNNNTNHAMLNWGLSSKAAIT